MALETSWNTGRLYQDHGQQIAARVEQKNDVIEILFVDVSRMIDGAIPIVRAPRNTIELRDMAMHGYDYGQYNSLYSSKTLDFNQVNEARNQLAALAREAK